MSTARVMVSGSSPVKMEPYFAALRAAGLEPFAAEASRGIAEAEGLLLTGGSDIDPRFYGQQPDRALGETDPERDAYELELLTLADRTGLPVLAICRGMQLVNVHRGGTLIQHLAQSERHRRRDTPASAAVHPVVISAGSRLQEILGADQAQVNSRHHQAVDRLGAGLAISARDAEDGVVEAIEDPSHTFLVAVQWHPEDQAPVDEVQRRLFTAFARQLVH